MKYSYETYGNRYTERTENRNKIPQEDRNFMITGNGHTGIYN
jgi:hypothetical protein